MADTAQELDDLLNLYIDKVPGTYQFQKDQRIAKLREVRAAVTTRKDFIKQASPHMMGCPKDWVECRNGECVPDAADCS